MPSVAAQRKVLDGRATVVSYERDPETFVLRVWRKDSRSYWTSTIDGVSDIDSACEKALDVFLEYSSGTSPRTNKDKGGVPKVRQKKGVLSTLVEEYLAEEQERSDKGLIIARTVKNKAEALRIHFSEYCKQNNLTVTTDIVVGVFDRYEVFRAGCSKHTIRRELGAIKMFVSWLHRRKLLNPYEYTADLFKPVKLRDDDWDSNPPIRDDKEWRTILKHIHRFVKEGYDGPKKKTGIARERFHTLIMVLKNSGMRPGEALALRWSDVEVQNIHRESSSGGKHDRYVTHFRVLESKTGASREVTANCAEFLARWELTLRRHLDKYEKHFRYNDVDLIRSEKDGLPIIPKDTLIFTIPEKNEWKLSDYSQYNYYWREIMRRAKDELRGPQLSPHHYTIYSLRSSRAMELFEMGVDPFLAGKQLGHLPDMMAKIYARLPSRRRAIKEAAYIQFGRKDNADHVDVELSEVSTIKRD